MKWRTSKSVFTEISDGERDNYKIFGNRSGDTGYYYYYYYSYDYCY